MTSKTPAARFFFTLLPIAVLVLVLTASTTESCHAQSFTGNGDGSSWNDGSNWSSGNVPSEGSRPSITSGSETGFSVQVNLPTTVGGVRIVSPSLTASLTVNAPLFGGVSCSGERGFLNMNANITGGAFISSGATFNLNSGILTGDDLNFRGADASPTFNQNGGNFNIENMAVDHVTVTIGSNDNVTGFLDVGAEGNVICDRPILIQQALAFQGGVLTINEGLTATLGVFLDSAATDEPGILNWNQGDITTPDFQILNGTINRTGGRWMVENFSIFRSSVAGMELLTIREEDVISGVFSISGSNIVGTNEPLVAATFEGPHSLGGIFQSPNSTVNYQQDSGETEGLALGRYSNFGGLTALLNLGFDSQSVDGLDWVLRVDGDEVEDLEDRIEDGQIIVTGADFSVEYDAVADVTYIQQTGVAIVIGDVNLDGAVDFLDISPFIARLTSGEFQAEADVDRSGAVDFLDISPFISVLTNQ